MTMHQLKPQRVTASFTILSADRQTETPLRLFKTISLLGTGIVGVLQNTHTYIQAQIWTAP